MKNSKKDFEILRADLWSEFDRFESDQKKNIPAPPVQKPYPDSTQLIDLPAPDKLELGQMSVYEAIAHRRSKRKYSPDPLTLEELSFLLWATQGVQKVINKGVTTLRTVPSGGARHPFETYLWINRVTGMASGIYRYLAIEHKLLLITASDQLHAQIRQGCADFAAECAVLFVWSAIPCRTEWRYGPLSPKLIAQDSGHVCENLYLACVSIGAGTCAVGAYNQPAMDELFQVDGIDEFVVYCAPVGKTIHKIST